MVKFKPEDGFSQMQWPAESNYQLIASLISVRTGVKTMSVLVRSKAQLPELGTSQHITAAFSILHHSDWQQLTSLKVEVYLRTSKAKIMTQLARTGLPCLERLDLSNNKLDLVAIQQLSTGLWPQLHQLVLRGVVMNEAAMIALSQGAWPSLVQLNLSHSPQLDAAAIAVIPQAVSWGALCELNLNGISLNAAGACAIAQLHKRLRCIYLGWCEVQLAGLSQLSLVSWPCLTALSLNNNRLRDSACAILSVTSMPNLSQLNLSVNHLDAAAAMQLVQAKMPRLLHLDVSSNNLNDAAMASLAKGHWPRLRNLLLVRNNFSGVGVELLMQSNWPRLCALCLDYMAVSGVTCNALAFEGGMTPSDARGKGQYCVYRDKKAMSALNNVVWPRLLKVNFV